MKSSSNVEQILELARWAPSGDNSQPWTFTITGESSLIVRLRDQADEDVYDYNQGQPSILSGGMLLEAIRRLALQGTELAKAYVGTLRLKLLKVGAVILRNTRRIRFLLSSAYPYQQLFLQVAARLAPG